MQKTEIRPHRCPPKSFSGSLTRTVYESGEHIVKTTTHNPSFSPVTRRTFLRAGAIVTAGLASLPLAAQAQVNKNSKLRIFQIGVGGIGGLQRGGLKGHAQVDVAVFCDVDRLGLDQTTNEPPNAWVVAAY